MEASYLGYAQDDDVNSLGPKLHSQIHARLHMEARAGHVRRQLASPMEGMFLPDYEYHSTSEDAINQARAAYRLIEQKMSQHLNYPKLIDSFVGSVLMYPLTLEKQYLEKQYEVNQHNWSQVSEERLQQLAANPNVTIQSAEPVLVAPGAMPEHDVYEYSVSFQRRRDVSKVKPQLVNFYDIIIDKYATCLEDAQIAGESTLLTRQQALDRYSNYDQRTRVVKALNEYYNESNMTPRSTKRIHDVCCRISEGEDMYIVRVVVLAETKTLLIAEQVNFMPYSLTEAGSIPGTLASVSLSERVETYQLLLTDLMRNLSTNALNSSQTQILTKPGNFASVTIGDSVDQRLEIVQDPQSVVQRQAVFATDVLQFQEYVIKECERMYGHASEFTPPSSGNISLYETALRDDQLGVTKEYYTTKFGQATRARWENAYRLMVETQGSCEVYIPELGQTMNYDLSEWPAQLRFEPQISIVKGTKQTNLVNKQEVYRISSELLQLGLISPEGVTHAATELINEIGADADQVVIPPPPARAAADRR